ncbi:MAG: GGDEF domain-containing protein [Gemmatimonadota bacterium]
MPESGSESDQPARVAAGSLALDLLTLRSAAEVEERVLLAVLETAGFAWVALYRPVDGFYEQSSAAGADSSLLPRQLAADLVEQLLADGLEMRACSSEAVGRVLTGVEYRAGLSGEFESRPLLFVVGPPAAANPPGAWLPTLRAIAEVFGVALRNTELVERLRSQVFVDFVTDCYNRRAFEEHLNVELVRARRYERPLSLLLLDLDDFKIVNDNLGHPVGDHALQRVAAVLRAAFRTTDRVCRYGGDEFGVIFPETSKEDALRLAERIRRQIAAIFPDAVNQYGITASIGVAAYPHDAARPDDLVRAADRALYRAKSEGRNQVISA